MLKFIITDEGFLIFIEKFYISQVLVKIPIFITWPISNINGTFDYFHMDI